MGMADVGFKVGAMLGPLLGPAGAKAAAVLGDIFAHADLAGHPAPSPVLARTMNHHGDRTGVPGELLSAAGAVLTRLSPAAYDGSRCGVTGLPIRLARELTGDGFPESYTASSADLQINKVQAIRAVDHCIQTTAEILAQLARRESGLVGAVVTYCEAGLPEALDDKARALEARKLAAEILGTFLAHVTAAAKGAA